MSEGLTRDKMHSLSLFGTALLHVIIQTSIIPSLVKGSTPRLPEHAPCDETTKYLLQEENLISRKTIYNTFFSKFRSLFICFKSLLISHFSKDPGLPSVEIHIIAFGHHKLTAEEQPKSTLRPGQPTNAPRIDRISAP